MDPRVLILGSGFGGLEAGKVLRGRPVGVTILDRRNYHLFQPLLYQVATATLSPGDIASPIRWIFRRAANVRVLLGEATAIDAANRRVLLDDGAALDYDFLIVATGASHTYFGHDDWIPHAPGLKTLEDALHIRRRILLAFERAEREPGRLNGRPPRPFVYRDLGNMAIAGRGSAVADLGWIRFSGVIAWFSWLFLHIVQLIGFRNRLLVLVQWAVAFVTFQRSVRLITNDDGRSDRSSRP